MLGKILDKFETGLLIIWELMGLFAATLGTGAMIWNLVAATETSIVITVLAAIVLGARVAVWAFNLFVGDPILASEQKEENAELFGIASRVAIFVLLFIHGFAFVEALIKPLGG